VVQKVASRAGKEWEEKGPDVAEQAAHRAVDSALWGISLRSRFLGAALRPFAQQVREAAGTFARDLAAAARTPTDVAGHDPAEATQAQIPKPDPPKPDPGPEDGKA
jgi:hypothetical protein